jgi:hypothetical protein
MAESSQRRLQIRRLKPVARGRSLTGLESASGRVGCGRVLPKRDFGPRSVRCRIADVRRRGVELTLWVEMVPPWRSALVTREPTDYGRVSVLTADTASDRVQEGLESEVHVEGRGRKARGLASPATSRSGTMKMSGSLLSTPCRAPTPARPPRPCPCAHRRTSRGCWPSGRSGRARA